MRKSIGKKLRFEVFKRDNFTCQYCSAKPPKVPLEIDHIVPVSKNGSNNIDNLITACFDCNRGKSDIELDLAPETLAIKIANRKLAVDQYNQYKRILKKEANRIEKEIDLIDETFNLYYPQYSLSEKFRITVKKFIHNLSFEETISSMESACIKVHDDVDGAIKYFCGICWNKIKNL